MAFRKVWGLSFPPALIQASPQLPQISLLALARRLEAAASQYPQLSTDHNATPPLQRLESSVVVLVTLRLQLLRAYKFS